MFASCLQMGQIIGVLLSVLAILPNIKKLFKTNAGKIVYATIIEVERWWLAMQFTTVEQVIHYMLEKSGKSGMFSLDPMLAICAKYGHFQRELKTIHIAGTNGKGSTAHFLATILREQGYQVGLFTSPFFINHRDRIRINDEWIPEDRMIEIANRYVDDFEAFELSFFEIDTFIALRYFYESHVDIAVIEVGLGGRLDATNVITPLVSAITNIGWDHMDYLGDTLAKIAFEKAGIIKSQRPVVIGADMVAEAEVVIREVALTRQADVIKTPHPTNIAINEHAIFTWKNNTYELSTPVQYQPLNAACALQVIEVLNQVTKEIHVDSKAIHQGLLKSVWLGRFQVIHRHPTWIIDGAHNAHGMRAMIQALRSYRLPNQPIKVLFAALRDKPVDEMLQLLQPEVTHLTLTTFTHYRSMNLATFIPPSGVVIDSHYHQLLDRWMEEADEDTLYLVTGSLYFLTEVVTYLKKKGWVAS